MYTIMKLGQEMREMMTKRVWTTNYLREHDTYGRIHVLTSFKRYFHSGSPTNLLKSKITRW